MGKLKVIDFFSGCGGSSLGIEQAGLDMVLAVDLWEDACKTHELNIDLSCMVQGHQFNRSI